jgi:heme exporter protein A
MLKPEGLSAVENLDFYGRLYSVPDRERRVREAIATTGLTLFAHDPGILLLDEPYTRLDQSARGLLDRLISEAKGRGRTILLVSHDSAEGLRAADQVPILARGRKVFEGPAAEWPPGRLAEAFAELTRPPAGAKAVRAS